MWSHTVAEATKLEKALLPQEAENLERQHDAGLTALRFEGEDVIAHATLWLLVDGWYELGTVWVHSAYRGRGLSAELYRELFATHPHRNVLATTTNPASLHIGLQVGMRCIQYAVLPRDVWRKTCCCPPSKTGSDDNVTRCRLRETSCFLRVTKETWTRLGSPGEIDFPRTQNLTVSFSAP